MLEVVEGIIEEIIFRNDDNGYTVFDICVEDSIFTLVGIVPDINEGEKVKANGRWITHDDYGDQFKVENLEVMPPDDVDSIKRYLASGFIKGIGPATAEKIVAHFGVETLNVMGNSPEKLSEVKGITVQKAFEIGEQFTGQWKLREAVLFLQQYDISSLLAMKIYKEFGDNTVNKVKNNPYSICDEIYGVGFRTADKIAYNMGVDINSRERISSGLRYVLVMASMEGHTYLLVDDLVVRACKSLNTEEDLVRDEVESLTVGGKLITEEERIYLKELYKNEVDIAFFIKMLLKNSSKIDDKKIDKVIEEFQKSEDINLDDIQKGAVKEALVNGVTVITGGPGTGKTTIIKTIIELMKREDLEVFLAAPTGRAAKRMTEATGYEAKTIHRMLEAGYMGEGESLNFARNQENPLDADVVIIDEMSMVDVILMDNLLKAIKENTKIILVGDSDQLPSVGPGNVLRDIISSGVVKCIRLQEIYRQEESSFIVTNAHKINRGEYPNSNDKSGDFFFLNTTDSNQIINKMIGLVKTRLPNTYGYDSINDIQVLSPMRKGVLGINNLNARLQEELNPPSANKMEKKFGDIIFREGDKVMQIKNNYDMEWQKKNGLEFGMGVFNGDVGRITEIDLDTRIVEVIYDDDKIVEYKYDQLSEVELAYAVTVHKSQGSEFPAIVMPIFQGPPMLMCRNVLYTAVTRASKLVVLVGSQSSAVSMVDNDKEISRFSSLCEKLKNNIH